jgi:pyrimidine-specific ribonucleoside hydrolase
MMRLDRGDPLRRIVIALIVIVVCPVAACTGGGDTSGDVTLASGARPFVVDTDAGSDDLMALLFLLQRPDVRIEAITISGTGLVHCEPGVRNVLAILDVARAPDIPVSCGPEEPLPSDYPYPGAFPTSWRIASDDAYGIDLPTTEREPDARPAPELLAEVIGGAADPVTLLTLGPLTNVALALQGDDGLVHQLERVVVMGGAVDVPGNVIRNGVAEWNVWVDPRAANVLLASGAPVSLVALDATNHVPITPYFAEALAAHHVTPEADTVQALFDAQPYLVEGGSFFWDPLAAALAVDPTLGGSEPRRLVVLEDSKETLGQTIEDRAGGEAQVYSGVAANEFESFFLNTLNGDEAVTSTRPKPDASVDLRGNACTYDGPVSFSPGRIDLVVSNSSGADLTVAIVELTGGATIRKLKAFIDRAKPGVEAPGYVSPVAFASTPPGEIAAFLPVDLPSGELAVVCITAEPFSVDLATGLRVVTP